RSRAGTTREMNRDHRPFVQRACGIPAAKRLMGVVVMNRISATAIVRWLAAAAILVSGGEHFRLWWFAHYRVIHIIGPLFLLNAIAGLLIALLLVWRANPLIELAGLGFAVSTLGAFFISVYVCLFGFQGVLCWTGHSGHRTTLQSAKLTARPSESGQVACLNSANSGARPMTEGRWRWPTHP